MKTSTSFKPEEKHFAWKGENAGYTAKHCWVYSRFGKANKCENKECLKISDKYEWSNNSGEYKRERSDWEMLCQSCHRRKDAGNYCKKGHPLFGDNIRQGRHFRICKTCAHDWYIKKSGEYDDRGRIRRRYKSRNNAIETT